MNRLIGISLLSILFTLSSNIQAKTLDPNDILQSVNNHFPVILGAQADISKAYAALLSAQGGFDPVISSRLLTSTVGVYKNVYSDTEVSAPISDTGNRFFTGYRLGRGNFPIYDQNMWTYNHGEVRAGVEVPWLRDKKIDTRRAKILTSRSSVEISEKELELKKVQAVRDALFSYWSWYTEGNKYIIQQQLLKLAQDRQAVIKHRFDKGDLPELDVIENQRIITQRQISLTEQAQNYRKASLLLSLYYRNSMGEPVTPTIDQLPHGVLENDDDISSTLMNNNFASILAQHPLMEQITQQRNISFIDLALAENNLKPKLSNKIYVAQDFGPGVRPLNRTSLNLEFTFELPLNQRQAIGEINAAKSSLERIDQDQKLFIDRLSVNIQNSKNEITMMDRVITLTEKELGIAKRLESAEEIKYEHGDSNLFVVNLREQSTAETRVKLVSAFAEMKKAKAEYLYSMGRVTL